MKTSNQYMIGPGLPIILAQGQTGPVQMSLGNNGIAATQFVCPQSIEVNALTLIVNNAVPSSIGFIGIYSEDGNNLLIQASFNTSVAGAVTVVPNVGLGTLLREGEVYWYATTCSDNSVRVLGATIDNGVLALLNADATRVGRATNLATSASMPSSLGAVSAFSVGFLGIALLES